MLSNADVIALISFPIVVFLLFFLTVRFAVECGRRLAHVEEEDVAAQENKKEERRRELKESISNRLIVKEWVSDDPQTESTEGDQDTSVPSQEMVETPQSPAPTINSSPASCEMGSEDCEPLAAEEEMVGCAICLSNFKPQQLVCESNNPSCRHIFHKDCMVDWLVNKNDSCPMCREVYLLVKTV